MSNYKLSHSSKGLTLNGHCVACVLMFWSINALFTEKPIRNSCRMISAVSFRVTHFFLKHAVKITLNAIWHTQQNQWFPPNSLAPCWGEPKALYSNKSRFLVASKTLTYGWWDSTMFRLQLTLPTAMEILSWLKQWRKCRPYKFSHV